MSRLRFPLRSHARAALWLVAMALLFAALSPTVALLRARAEPVRFAELCTAIGFVRVALTSAPASAPDAPAESGDHGPQCAWCLQPATWLALAGGAGPAVLPAMEGAPEPPPRALSAPSSPRLAIPFSRGPPALA